MSCELALAHEHFNIFKFQLNLTQPNVSKPNPTPNLTQTNSTQPNIA